MKTSIVPAQITTVEDKIAGSLTLQQVVLLLAPLLLGFVIFVMMPPTLQLAFYKVVLVGIAALISGLLAIRVKDKMLLFWLLTIVRYNARPRYYVYSKNDSFLRDEPQAIEEAEQVSKAEVAPVVEPTKQQLLTTADMVVLEEIIANPQANIKFKTGKDGRLNVLIQEVKQ